MSRVREFPLPDLGEGLTEGEILKWLVQVGDVVELNQPVVEVETAKAAVEIPAKWAGRITAIFHPEGAVVDVGTPIFAVDTDPDAGDLPAPSAASLAAVELASEESPVEPGLIGGPAPGGRTAVLVGYGPKTGAAKRRPRKATATPVARPATPPAPVAVAPAATAAPAPAPVVPAASPAPAPAAPAGVRNAPVLAKPPVRKLAKDLGVDLGTVTGTGPLGSITRDDVHRAAAQLVAAPATVVGGGAAAPAFGPDREQRIPVRGVRKLTAQNMVASAFTAPHVTEFLSVDVTATMQLRDRLRADRAYRDVKLTPLAFVAKAVCLAVERTPELNARWDEDAGEIVYHDHVQLGIAAATPRGLIVPKIRDADTLSLRELAIVLAELTETARAGKTPPSDLVGGTFTITNVGVFGVDTGTPILNPGEAGILAVGAIKPMPWVVDGELAVRTVCQLALSFDHRLVDGEQGSRFLADVGALLSDPGLALTW